MRDLGSRAKWRPILWRSAQPEAKMLRCLVDSSFSSVSPTPQPAQAPDYWPCWPTWAQVRYLASGLLRLWLPKILPHDNLQSHCSKQICRDSQGSSGSSILSTVPLLHVQMFRGSSSDSWCLPSQGVIYLCKLEAHIKPLVSIEKINK